MKTSAQIAERSDAAAASDLSDAAQDAQGVATAESLKKVFLRRIKEASKRGQGDGGGGEDEEGEEY